MSVGPCPRQRWVGVSRGFPPAGPGCSAPGAGPLLVPGSRSPFPVPVRRSRRRGSPRSGGTSPWPGRSRCSAPLKVSVSPRGRCALLPSPGDPAPRCAGLAGRSGGAVNGCLYPRCCSCSGLRGNFPEFLPGAPAVGPILPGCRAPPAAPDTHPGAVHRAVPTGVPHTSWGTHGC